MFAAVTLTQRCALPHPNSKADSLRPLYSNILSMVYFYCITLTEILCNLYIGFIH